MSIQKRGAAKRLKFVGIFSDHFIVKLLLKACVK